MYTHVKNKPRPKRDRMLLAALLAVAAVIGALIPPVYMALGASYKYHEFVLAYAQSLTAARDEHGVITLTLETGEQKRVSADDVSAAFVTLTGFGFGQPVKKTPDVPALTVTLPDGAALSYYDTPSDNGLEYPSGVTVRFAPAEGKPFTYLQRYAYYEDLVRSLKR